MTEDQLQRLVIELARKLGYFIYHTQDSRHNHWATTPGYPDLHLVRVPRSIYVELKGDTAHGKRGPDGNQKLWIARLEACGHEVYVWYPKDINDIATILSRRTR